MKAHHYIIIFALIFISCGTSPLVEDQWSSSEGWADEDFLMLEFDISDTTLRYDLVISIDHETEFKWQNVYVEIGNITPNNDTLKTPVSLELGNHKGRWNSDCSGSSCHADIDLKTNFHFKNNGKYIIWAKPYMRINPVQGISKVKFSLSPSKKEI